VDAAGEVEQERAWSAALVRVLSHDAQSPLTTVAGFARTLERPGISEEARATAVSAIVRNAHRLSLLLRNLVDASRLRSGDLAVRSVPVALADVVAGAVRRVAEVEATASRVHVTGEGGQVLADPDRLATALVNVLHNALLFSPADCPVSVELAGAEVVVEDEGRGFTDDDLAHAHEAFWRGPETPGAGAGLGLHLAARFVEAMDGTWALERARPGGGARVRLSMRPAPA
jgi:two-component system sensor histidine kinase KdpD